MKDTLKKVCSCILSISLCFTLFVPVFAADKQTNSNSSIDKVLLEEILSTSTAVENNISNGEVATQYLKILKTQLEELNDEISTVINSLSSEDMASINSTLNDVEKIVKRINSKDAFNVQASILKVRTNLKADTGSDQTATNKKASITFTDVPKDQWYYNSVMDCVEKGLMQGMGNGIFSPSSQMTVAQFITVAINATYPNQTRALAPGETDWWAPYYELAVEKGLINSNEYTRDSKVMNAPITRKEMSRIASRVTQAKGEKVESLVNTSIIADYNSIGGVYKPFVVDCFAKGILVGMDDIGTFNPDGVLTRAEACTVAIRLLDKSTRKPVEQGVTPPPPSGEIREFKVGESRTARARAGDIFVKLDGTRVVLKETVLTLPNGKTVSILGLYQDVDYVTGWGDAKVGERSPDGSKYVKDNQSNLVLSVSEWEDVKAGTNPGGKYVGSYNGEVYNTYWQWDSELMGGGWSWIGPQGW